MDSESFTQSSGSFFNFWRDSLKSNLDLISLSLFIGLCLFEFHFYLLLLVVFGGISHAQKKNKVLVYELIYILIFSIIAISTALNNNGFVSIMVVLALFSLFNIYYSVYSTISNEGFLLAGSLFLLFFILLEIKIVWIWFNNVESTPLELVYLIKSPLLVVPNDLAYMVCIFPFFRLVDSVANQYEQQKKVFIVVNYILFIAASIILESRLSIAVISLYILFSLLKKKLPNKVMYLSLISGFLLIFLGATFFLEKPIEVFGTRIMLWIAGLEGIIERPIIGHGFDSFGSYYDQFRFSINRTESILFNIDQRYIPWPHNLFIDLAFSFGVLILIPVSILFGKIISRAQRSANADDPLISAVGLFFIVAMLEITYLRPATVLIVALICALLKNQNLFCEPYSRRDGAAGGRNA